MIRAVSFFLLSAAALPASSQPMLSLPLAGDARVLSVSHDCSDGVARQVSYVTSGSDSLAVFGRAEAPTIFVQVVAASGARYVAGTQEWWVKGDQAALRDLTIEDAGPVTCRARG